MTRKNSGRSISNLWWRLSLWAKEIQFGRLTKGKLWKDQLLHQSGRGIKVFLDDGEVPLDNNATEGLCAASACTNMHGSRSTVLMVHNRKDHLQYHGNSKGESSKSLPLSEYILTVMKDHQEDTDYCFMEELLPKWSEQTAGNLHKQNKTTNSGKPTAGNGGHK